MANRENSAGKAGENGCWNCAYFVELERPMGECYANPPIPVVGDKGGWLRPRVKSYDAPCRFFERNLDDA